MVHTFFLTAFFLFFSVWNTAFDEGFKKTYYYNMVTRETLWQLPPGAILVDQGHLPRFASTIDQVDRRQIMVEKIARTARAALPQVPVEVVRSQLCEFREKGRKWQKHLVEVESTGNVSANLGKVQCETSSK